jgi:hypothetical protein
MTAQNRPTVPRAARQAASQPSAVRKAAPARPLGPKSRAFIAELNRQEAVRAAKVQQAVQVALALTAPSQPARVRKAADDPDKALVAVYRADGSLAGVTQRSKITYLAEAPTAAPASKPASSTVPDSDPRQPPAGTQLPQPGPAAAAAASPVADPSQPATLPVGPNQLADEQDEDPVTAAVTKALATGQLDGLTRELRKRAVDGTPRQKQDAFDALQTLALLAFKTARSTGGQRQMSR